MEHPDEMVMWKKDRAGLTVLAFIVIVALVAFALVGCQSSGTPGRQKVEEAEAIYSETGNANDDKQYDAWEKAYRIERNKAIDLELAAALVKPSLANDAAEITRLNILALQRRAATDKAIADFRALHDKNVQTNRANAARARQALKGQKPQPPLDLGQQINGTSGTAPAAPTLIGQ